MTTTAICSTTLNIARRYAAAGLCTIPILPDGTKGPAIPSWKSYQTQPPLPDELDDWFEDGQKGIAIVCGKISGGLEVLDFEVPAIFNQWQAQVEHQAPGLLYRLPLIQTPRPGRHVYYRCDQGETSHKLARSATKATMIELKGEGGYVLAPGSPAACHPNGKLYEHVRGPSLCEIPLITAREREILQDSARSFDASPRPAALNGHRSVTVTTITRPDATARAIAYLGKCEPAISGQAGHDKTMEVARAIVYGFDLGPEVGFDLLWQHYNPRCQPPWTEAELRHKCKEAEEKPFDKPRGYLLTDTFEMETKPMLSSPVPSTNGCPAYSSGPLATTSIWNPVPISKLKRSTKQDSWVWKCIVAPGKITLLSAEAKAGKTTLLSLLFKKMEEGGTLCGTEVYPGRVIVISEETPDTWLDRRDKLALNDNIEILSIPFLSRPSRQDWERLIADAANALLSNPVALVVLDSLNHLWPIEDENDNSKVATALMPIRKLTQTGTAVCLVHHFSAEKKGPRGATELRALPDQMTDFHLFVADDFEDRRRVLKTKGRLGFDPSKLTIRLNPGGTDYEVLDGILANPPKGMWEELAGLVPKAPPGRTAKEFANHWPTQPAPAPKEILRCIQQNFQRARWQCDGSGQKNDPYRFYVPENGSHP